MTVGTAASMDGYTAYGASITKDGNKQTFDCPAPLGMLFDRRSPQPLPRSLSASGYADLIAKIPAGADWMLADAVGSDPIDPFAFALVQDDLQEALSDPAGVHAGEVGKTGQLAEGLLLSGFAMQAVQSSRPCLGSRAPVQPPVGHGAPALQRRFGLPRLQGRNRNPGLDGPLRDAAGGPRRAGSTSTAVSQRGASWSETESDIRALFGDNPELVARALKETRDKYVGKEGLREEPVAAERGMARACGSASVGRSSPSGEVQRRLRSSEPPANRSRSASSRTRFLEAFRKLPYMRSRYSVVDVAVRCGWMEAWLERLFGPGCVWSIH